MVRKFIKFGQLNKKLLLPFIFAVSQIAHKMFNRYFYPENRTNLALNQYVTSIGMASVIFLPYIMKIKYEETDKEKKIHKKKYLHYSILAFIFLVYTIMKTIPPLMKGTYAAQQGKSINPFSEGPFLLMGLEMVFLTLFSIFFLKYRYFKHHIIGIILFIICGVCCDMFLRNYSEIFSFSAIIIIIEFLSILTDSTYYYYQKYMMEKLYYPYWRIAFTFGIAYFLFATGFLIYILSDKDKINSSSQLIKSFYSYFNGKEIGIKIVKLIVLYIFIAINTALNILIIYYFNPNFILISFQISKIVQVLIDKDKEKFYCIFFFVFQFLGLMIYLEIIELNFCKLNENTKYNINLRGLLDISDEYGRDSSVSTIEIDKEYLIDSDSINENEKGIEMNFRTSSINGVQEN